MLDVYGGRNPKLDFSSHTNIIFSSGSEDPWRVGGIQEQLWDAETTGLVYVPIEEAPHHYDLMGEHPDDSEFVIEARQTEIEWIRRFVDSFNSSDEEEILFLQ